MIRRFFSYAYLFIASWSGYCLALVAPLIVEPVMRFIRDAPAAAAYLFRLPAQLIVFMTIGLLKPVYRESYETDGLSLTSARA